MWCISLSSYLGISGFLDGLWVLPCRGLLTKCLVLWVTDGLSPSPSVEVEDYPVEGIASAGSMDAAVWELDLAWEGEGGEEGGETGAWEGGGRGCHVLEV